jgi:hypothetical protein
LFASSSLQKLAAGDIVLQRSSPSFFRVFY